MPRADRGRKMETDLKVKEMADFVPWMVKKRKVNEINRERT